VLRSIGYFRSPELLDNMSDADKKHAFMSIQLKGDNDDTILNNYKKVEPDLLKLRDEGIDVQYAGLQPLANELTGTIGEDQQRAEVAAIPLVSVVLFFVFGTVVAAALPAFIGGLTILGALGIMRFAADFIPVHFFAQPVVTLIGLGIAIDYGLFIVSRFREELAEGYDTEVAIRRTMMTSGRTVVFSAVIIVASSVPLLLFPQGFLKSITYAIIASVMLAAILSITVLAAALAILGPPGRRARCEDAAAVHRSGHHPLGSRGHQDQPLRGGSHAAGAAAAARWHRRRPPGPPSDPPHPGQGCPVRPHRADPRLCQHGRLGRLRPL
jgi:uncharacterized membrane protein YdfJ with MMPL/SSD domain